jgi:hypothetical protein|tara:strand:+ start:1057 stop:1524 length:468 start_codon:yes stop_codon:yes gene_type:complete
MYLPARDRFFKDKEVTRVSLSDTVPVYPYFNESLPEDIDWDDDKKRPLHQMKKIMDSIKEEGLRRPLIGFRLPENMDKFNGDHRQRYDKLHFIHRNSPKWLELLKRPLHVVCGCQRWYVLHKLEVEETDMMIYNIQTEAAILRQAELACRKEVWK